MVLRMVKEALVTGHGDEQVVVACLFKVPDELRHLDTDSVHVQARRA
jgi:hypothetical protein